MKISVGIQFAPQIHLFLKKRFSENNSLQTHTGELTVYRTEDGTYLKTDNDIRKVELPLLLEPDDYQEAEFELSDVTIGINFHWERKENQSFKGSLKIIQEDDKLTAINILDIEDYLLSVISSEMNATSSLEFLKAHAVISRSWLLAQQEKTQQLTRQATTYRSVIQNDREYIRWFDREDHLHFDVCADDHCQRYQGINKASTPLVEQAVRETKGEVITYNGQICDARFSKCCGGVTEKFANVWEPVDHPYLQKVYDAPNAGAPADLTGEEQARKWILNKPDVFCNTTDKTILSNVLNDYDQETQDFFRWEVYYTQAEISQLVKERLSIDFGQISDLIPVQRGESGRLIKLKIVGDKKTLIIGKELLIRKAFSHSHLYSSAFLIEKEEQEGTVRGFRLKGAGWGHGVGLCQIGAAVMGAKGYKYKEILTHYFVGAEIRKNY